MTTGKSNKAPYKDLLADIQKLNEQDFFKVFVPSAGKSVLFAPLTVKQQKAILSGGVDTKIENLTFTNTLNDIILENCTDKSLRISVLDRTSIILQLRHNTLGDSLIVTDDDGDDHVIDLKQHLKECQQHKFDKKSLNFSVSESGVTIACTVPTLQVDTTFNKNFTKKIKKNTKKDQENIGLTDLIGDIYVYELVKYIDTLTINENVADFRSVLSFQQMIELFEGLPMKVSKVLVDKIKEVREYDNKMVESDQLPDDTSITIDASMFTTE